MGILDTPSYSRSQSDLRYLTQATADSKYMTSALSPLYGYFAKLSQAKSARCNIVMVGDSIAEGYGAATVPDRWVDMAQVQLRAKYQNPAIVGGTYVKAMYNAGPTAGNNFPAWTFTGTTAGQSYGLGGASRQLNIGATATITRTCSSFDLFLRAGGGSPAVTVSIDGGAAVSVPITNTLIKWSSGALTPGSHTVVVTATADTAVLAGAYFYNGDEASGVAIWDGSKSGARAETWVGLQDPWRHAGLISADLVVIGVLTNDSRTVSSGYSSAQYKTNLQTMVANARQHSGNANLPILFMTPYKALGTLIEPWTNYTDKIKEIVAATPYTAFYDMSNTIPDLTNDVYGMLMDGVHPTSKGHALLASLAANSGLSPR